MYINVEVSYALPQKVRPKNLTFGRSVHLPQHLYKV